jgi:hypothetical protein
MSTLTLIILLVNVFLMGIVAAVAARYLRAHYQQKDNVVKPQDKVTDPAFPKLDIPKEIIDRITKESEEHYRRVLANSATYLQQSLVGTATDTNNHVKSLVNQIINDELARYREDMAKMRQQAAAQIGGIQQELDSHKQELRAKLAQEMEVEKQQLAKQIDTKLADAVASFLIETLGHNVDLGNQNEYLTSLLEEHKADFVKEVASTDRQPVNSPPAPNPSPVVTAQPLPQSAAPAADPSPNQSVSVQTVATDQEVPSETKPA